MRLGVAARVRGVAARVWCLPHRRFRLFCLGCLCALLRRLALNQKGGFRVLLSFYHCVTTFFSARP